MNSDAYLTLAYVAEPADPVIGGYVRQHGPERTLDAIRSGQSGLRDGAGLRARLARVDVDLSREQCDRIGARIITRGSAEWPSQLDDLGDKAPFALWVIGAADLRLVALRSLAVVGTRASTRYGEAVCRDWCGQLASAQWSIVSGGAFGIDACAHKGALAVGGVTVAILACGVDVAYPRAHEALFAQIADQGLLVSESPPGESARRHRFLSRNRLIAAISRATVVIEAAMRSGTTATANAAFALNRHVVAVPGPVTSPMSAGCHTLIRDQGAVLASCADDVLELVEPLGSTFHSGGQRRHVESRILDDLDHRQMRVLDAFPRKGAVTIDELVREAGLGPRDVAAALGLLSIGGLVHAVGQNWERHWRA